MNRWHLLATMAFATACLERGRIAPPETVEQAMESPAPPSPFNCPPPEARDNEVLMVDIVAQIVDDRGCNAFNEGRPYVVSVHTQLGDAAMTELVGALKTDNLAGSVVALWFGDRPVDRVQVEIGKDVPRALATAAIAVARAHTEAPLVVFLNPWNQGHGEHRRVFIGTFPITKNTPTSVDDLDRLLDPTLDDAAFWALLPPREEAW